ncbi:hypothetical protein [Actinocorallia longicatena]|uniref:Enoyl-ACP reductase-like protein n=1 Tax=Actinocorallia longicatena TaxID=111803 RepID=A0ABP6PX24_9ACTN
MSWKPTAVTGTPGSPASSRITPAGSPGSRSAGSSEGRIPEHVAGAVFALTGGDLTHTTGLHIPVDAGVAAALLR